MKLLRLQVQVLPWQDTAATIWDRKEIILPWTEACPENLTISELAGKIETRFENIHKGKGKLTIKWLEDGYCGILDGNDTVSDCFADRTGGMAHVKDFTVRVARFPPDPQELQTPTRFASIAPESTARPQKRHRNHLLDLATSGRQEYIQANRACGTAHKRQRLGERRFEGGIDPDRPVLSSERDEHDLFEEPGRTENCTSTYIIADSQPSPCKHQYDSYGTPQSLSVSSPRGLLASCQTELVTISNLSPHRDILSAGDIEKLVQSSIDTQPKSESPDSQNQIYSVPHSNASTPVAAQDPVDTPAPGPFVKPLLPTSTMKYSHRPVCNIARTSITGATPYRTPERHFQASTAVATSEKRLTRLSPLKKANYIRHVQEKINQRRKLARDIYEPIESDSENSQELPRLNVAEATKKTHSPTFKPRPFSRISESSNHSQSQSYTIPDTAELLIDWPGSTLHPVGNRTEVASDTAAQPKRPVSAEKIRCESQPGDPRALDLRSHRASDELTEIAKVAFEKSEHKRYGLQQIGKGNTISPLEPWEGHDLDGGTRIARGQDRNREVEQRSKLSMFRVGSNNREHANEQAIKVGGLGQRGLEAVSSAQRPPGVKYTKPTMYDAPTPVSKKGPGSSGKNTQRQKAAEGEWEKEGKAQAAADNKALKASEKTKTQEQRAQENRRKQVDHKARMRAELLAAALAKERKTKEETQRSESRVALHQGLSPKDPDRAIAPRSLGASGGNIAASIDKESEFSQDLPCRGTYFDVQIPSPGVFQRSPATSPRFVSLMEQPIKSPYALCRETSVKPSGADKTQYDILTSSVDVEINEPSLATSKIFARPVEALNKSRNSSSRSDMNEKKQSKLKITKTVEKGKARASDQPSPPKASHSKTVIELSESETSSSETGAEPPAVDSIKGLSKRQSTSTLPSIKSDRGISRPTSFSHEPTTLLERRTGSAVKARKIEYAIVGVRSQLKSPSRSPAREVISSASPSSEAESELDSESDSESENASELAPSTSLEVVPKDQQRPSTTAKEIPFIISHEKHVVASSPPVRTNGQKFVKSPEISSTFRKSITASEISSSEDEAEQQLQREARQLTKPSHTTKIIAPKAPDFFQISTQAGGNVSKLSPNGVRPAYGRFPSLSGLKSKLSTGMRERPMARKLAGFVVPIDRVQLPLSSSTKGNGSRISDGSSSESSYGSSSSDEGNVETSRATGASGGRLTQASQGKSTKGLHGILKSMSDFFATEEVSTDTVKRSRSQPRSLGAVSMQLKSTGYNIR